MPGRFTVQSLLRLKCFRDAFYDRASSRVGWHQRAKRKFVTSYGRDRKVPGLDVEVYIYLLSINHYALLQLL